MKIYIIGPVGSGKTTLAKKLSKKYSIKYHELDKIVWDDENGNIKRTDAEINKLFNKIIREENWIIEDVGRKKFEKGLEQCDKIYYINLNPITIYFRVTKRWIKQKLRLEKYNYKPTIKGLIQMYKWAHKDIKQKNEKLKNLKQYNKLIILNKKEV